MLYHHSTQRAWSNFSQAFSSTRGQMEVFLWLVTELNSILMPFVRVHRVKCLEKWTDHHWQNCCLQFVLKQLISTEVSIYCKYKVSDSISKAFSLKAGDEMWVTVWRCEAAQLRLGIAGHHWGEHLALIIWLPTAPPRSLQSATQSSDSATTLPARLYTDSSAWAGDGVEFSTLNKQGLRPPLWCPLSNESVMRVAEKRHGRFLLMWIGSAHKCAPWLSTTIILLVLRSWDRHESKTRAERSPQSPCTR